MKRIITFGVVLAIALTAFCFPIERTGSYKYTIIQSIAPHESIASGTEVPGTTNLDGIQKDDEEHAGSLVEPLTDPLVDPLAESPVAPFVESLAESPVTAPHAPTVHPVPPASAAPQQDLPFSWDRGGNYTGPISIREAYAPGLLTKTTDKAVLDYSKTSDGYVMLKWLYGD